MGTTKDVNIEQAILETAERLFLDKGFALTSTTEIAAIVGCNQAMVHYYFRTKEKLFKAVFEKKVRLFLSAFLHVGEGENLTFEEKLKRKIGLHFDMLKANPKLPFLIFNELSTNPQRLQSIIIESGDLPGLAFQQLESELQAEIERGTIRPIHPADLILTIVSLNVMLFLASPMVKATLGMSDDQFLNFVEHRKKENMIAILNSLEPQSTS